MKRILKIGALKRLLTGRALKNVVLIPKILKIVKNWPFFLIAYMRLTKKGGKFILNNGLKILFDQPIASGTVMVVFVRQNYGKLDQNSKVIIDVGANIGVFMVMASNQAPNSKVICYEPNPDNFMLLNNNIKENDLFDRVSARNVAVDSESGIVKMGKSLLSPMHSLVMTNNFSQTFDVQCITLTDIFVNEKLENIDVLKLNCEGSEYNIIYKANPEIFKKINEIRMEFHEIDDNLKNGKAIVAYLRNVGYKTVDYQKYNSESGFIIAKK